MRHPYFDLIPHLENVIDNISTKANMTYAKAKIQTHQFASAFNILHNQTAKSLEKACWQQQQ